MALTLLITWRARTRAGGASGFYAAGGNITARQNALAIAGDYLSAASFLGATGVFYTLGGDGMLYAVGAVVGWPITLLLFGERLRALGRYTFSDVLGYRLRSRPVRLLAAVTTLAVSASYLLAQMVAAGTLVELLFGVPFRAAVALVGSLMIIYVMFGGMVATTWIQIIKACLLLVTAALIALLVLRHFDFSIDAVVGASGYGPGGPGQAPQSAHLLPDPWSALSLALAFTLGPAGFPHILMRFFTVRDARTARRSLEYATLLIAVFQLLVIVLGYGAAALVARGRLGGGANMAAVLLAGAVGGDWLLGLTAAVTFATILAVVSGLTLAAATAVSHDLYKHVLHAGRASEAGEIRVSRMAVVAIGGAVIAASILFQNQNVAFLATMPLVIAASANFPLLLLTLYWRGFTTRGALACGCTGLATAIVLLAGSPKVWVGAFGWQQPFFPHEYPTAFALAAALLAGWVASVTDRSASGRAERAAFAAQSEIADGQGGLSPAPPPSSRSRPAPRPPSAQ